MSLKTTLVYAGIAGKGFDSLKQGMDSGWIGHGLCSISSYGKSQGYPMDLIDLRALRDWAHFRSEVAERQPQVAGFSMMSVDFNPVMEAVRIVKEVNPDIVTVVGGPHPTVATEECADNPLIDYTVVSEGEITFANLLKAIDDGRRPEDRVLRGIHPVLDQIPFADRDLFLTEWRKFGYDLDSPEVPFVKELPGPFVTLIAGRGCRYTCNFCKPHEDFMFGRGTRRRSVKNVIEELKSLRERYHFNSFMFHDDCLTEDRNWVTEFCQMYKAEGFTQSFFCQSRADIIVKHEDMVKMMAEAGLGGYFIGFESGSDRVLKFIHKGTTRQKNLDAAAVCKKYGLAIWANYMIGIPSETNEEVKQTVSMLKEIDPDYYSPSFYTPHPGSDLYDYCMENGISLVSDHNSYRRNPTETKIVGQDIQFLMWALEESKKRRIGNQLRRTLSENWKRYASPKKAVRKVRRLVLAHSA